MQRYQFSFCGEHVPGVHNTAADALSRDNASFLLSPSTGCPNQGPKTTAGSSPHLPTQLGISALDHSVRQYFTRSLALATLLSYRSAANHYLAFCSQFNLHPLPLSQSSVVSFVVYLAETGVSYATLRTYQSGIRSSKSLMASRTPIWVHILHLYVGVCDSWYPPLS